MRCEPGVRTRRCRAGRDRKQNRSPSVHRLRQFCFSILVVPPGSSFFISRLLPPSTLSCTFGLAEPRFPGLPVWSIFGLVVYRSHCFTVSSFTRPPASRASCFPSASNPPRVPVTCLYFIFPVPYPRQQLKNQIGILIIAPHKASRVVDVFLFPLEIV